MPNGIFTFSSHSTPLLHFSTPSLFFTADVQSSIVNASADDNEYITTIDALKLPRPDLLRIMLEIPQELLEMFPDIDGQVRVISSLYNNIQALFPDGLLRTRNE